MNVSVPRKEREDGGKERERKEKERLGDETNGPCDFVK